MTQYPELLGVFSLYGRVANRQTRRTVVIQINGKSVIDRCEFKSCNRLQNPFLSRVVGSTPTSPTIYKLEGGHRSCHPLKSSSLTWRWFMAEESCTTHRMQTLARKFLVYLSINAMLSGCDVCRQEGGATPWVMVMRVVHLSVTCRSRTMMDDLA